MKKFTKISLQGNIVSQNWSKDPNEVVISVDRLSNAEGELIWSGRLFINYDFVSEVKSIDVSEDKFSFKIPEKQFEIWERNIAEQEALVSSTSEKEKTLQILSIDSPKPTFPTKEELAARKDSTRRDD